MPTHLQWESLTSTIQFAIAVMFALMAIITYCEPIPKKKEYKTYNTSRLYLVVALIILCIHFFLQWFTAYRIYDMQMSVMINLTFAFPAIIVHQLSSITLLRGYCTRKEHYTFFGSYLIQLAIIWATWYFCNEFLATAQIISAIIFFGQVVFGGMLYYKEYKNAVNEMNNYYDYDAENVAHVHFSVANTPHSITQRQLPD